MPFAAIHAPASGAVAPVLDAWVSGPHGLNGHQNQKEGPAHGLLVLERYMPAELFPHPVIRFAMTCKGAQ